MVHSGDDAVHIHKTTSDETASVECIEKFSICLLL